MNKQPMTLEQRIAVALQPDTGVTSADVAALIEETEAGIAEAEKERAMDQTLSLDPTAARQAIADATFTAVRLRALLSKLQACYQQVRDEEERTAWLPRPSMASAFAATSMVPAYHPTDWHNYERRAAAQERARQHMADYYARTTREQEERENREARERFAESQRKRHGGS